MAYSLNLNKMDAEKIFLLSSFISPDSEIRCFKAMDVMVHSSTFLLLAIPANDGRGLTYALVLLNQRLPLFTPVEPRAAQLHVCADGGANRLYDELPQILPHEDVSSVRNRYKPDVIKGDMDSIRAEVLDFYRNLLCILVAGALGGRFDHEVGNKNVICRFSAIRIILLSEDCLIQLLPSSHLHEIHIQHSVEGPHCGLVPIGTPSRSTTTTGLQWNLTDTEMRFGGLISTSNIVEGEIITVQSDSDLLWTISININVNMKSSLELYCPGFLQLR